MASVDISQHISASPEAVWEELRQIDRHVHWMLDAAEIRFLSTQHEGLGTKFECDTKIGPLKVTDIMEVTEWNAGKSIRVRHKGVVTGEGNLAVAPETDGSSIVRWTEDLKFPWYFGGPIGAQLLRPIFVLIWRGNLKRLAARIV
jgi:carbon monoxide dehydrogenase subunit G